MTKKKSKELNINAVTKKKLKMATNELCASSKRIYSYRYHYQIVSSPPQIGNIKPETEITWYKDKIEIEADDDDAKKIEMKDGVLTFNIGKVRPSDRERDQSCTFLSRALVFFFPLVFVCKASSPTEPPPLKAMLLRKLPGIHCRSIVRNTLHCQHVLPSLTYRLINDEMLVKRKKMLAFGRSATCYSCSHPLKSISKAGNPKAKFTFS